MKPILIAERVSKKYSRNLYAHRGYGLADLVQELFRWRGHAALRTDEFWAVKDVSFSLHPGESLAVIGRNGSGKSTLLKMLHGLCRPDEGRIWVDGTVQALINLGAGFDPVLSGRENVLNAAALAGLGPRETARRLGEIVAFSGLEEVLDSPVGTYSSGMYARLGFSVAIHLDPSIILIDEILAVGDVAFQNKCFAKMHQLRKQEVTMVLVSHSFSQVTQFCDRALWLEQGQLRAIGDCKDVVKQYLSFMEELEIDRVEAFGHQPVKVDAAARQELYGALYDELDELAHVNVELTSSSGRPNVFRVHDSLTIEYQFQLRRRVSDLNVSLNIYRTDGLLMTTISTLNGDLAVHIHEGWVRAKVTIEDLNVNPGEYVLVMPVHEGHSYLYRNLVARFTVVSNDELSWGTMSFRYDYKIVSD